MQPSDEILNPFGELLDPELLLGFAEVTAIDIESAVEWFDEHASEEWQGALEAPPFKESP